MADNFSGLSGIFNQMDTYVEATLVVDGQEYEMEHFGINFVQEVDHKGQPQAEMKGGQLSVTLTQAVNDSIYDWAKRANKRKDGKILFRSQTEGTVLEIAFFNANCTKLTKTIGAFFGMETNITISPEKVSLNEFTHDNKWRK